MCIYHKENYKGFIIEIVKDDNPTSSKEWDNLGTMVCWYNQDYNLGDGLPEQMRQRFQTLESKYGLTDLVLFDRWKRLFQKQLVILPFYLYDHSGISISTEPFDGPWDSGQIGWIFATHEQIKLEFDVGELTQNVLDVAKQVLISEVETYDQYLRNGIFGYVVKDTNGDHLDSCWGFYGDPKEYCLDEARRAVDYQEQEKFPLFFQPADL